MKFENDRFYTIIKVSSPQDLVFKFIINGNWCTSDFYNKHVDEHGNTNNIVSSNELTIFEEFNEEDNDEKIKGSDNVGVADSSKGEDVVATPKENVADPKNVGIHQVLTNSSSFAAVSVPSNDDPESISEDIKAEPDLSESTSTLNYPGSFPSFPELKKKEQKTSLVSRFRGLFR